MIFILEQTNLAAIRRWEWKESCIIFKNKIYVEAHFFHKLLEIVVDFPSYQMHNFAIVS